jgi:hypothetical protein
MISDVGVKAMSSAVFQPEDQSSPLPETDQAMVGKVKEFIDIQKVVIIPSILSGPPGWVCYDDPLAICIRLSVCSVSA